MNRNDILNALIDRFNYQTYLEIGVDSGQNFSLVNCDFKVGVDPNENTPATLHMTSDEFFIKHKYKFDLIFVDGLHEHHQVKRDILNSLRVLNEGGTIVCHDMNPAEEIHQVPPDKRVTRHWNGDCWKAWVELRSERSDLEMFCVDTDQGCGIIRFGKDKSFILNSELNYTELEKNRINWLNLVDIDYFKQWLKA